MFTRHTAAIFTAVFSLTLTAALSLISVFGFPEYFVLVYLSTLSCALIALYGSTSPEYRLSKLALSVVFPFFGAPFCFFLRRRAKKCELEIFEKKPNGAQNLQAARDGGEVDIIRGILSSDPQAMVFSSTDCRYFSDGKDMLADMISDIRKAKEFVFLEYYIISEGRVWSTVLSELTACVNRGVEVRVMFDDLGSMKTLPVKYEERLCGLGINAKAFYPISGRMSIHNNRNHRKTLIIDGKIAYVGGLNLSDEYANLVKPFGVWKDSGVRLYGECAIGFCSAFLSVWDFNCGKRGENERYFKNKKLTDAKDSRFVSFSSAPKPLYKRNVAKDLILNLVNRAKNYVFITTPYLVADCEIIGALGRAVTRGVSVKIITPGIPDKKIMKIVSESFYPALLSEGVEIFEYSPGFIHGKSVVCDDELAVVGSVNLDYRSLAHNFENGVLIYKDSSVLDVKRGVLDVISESSRISEAKLGVKKKAVRLFAGAILPIL